MNISNLIANVPAVDDLDKMCDWFSDVKQWATINSKEQIAKDANTAFFFSNVPTRVAEFRRKLLSQLKTMRKGEVFMDDVIKVFIVHGHDGALKEAVARLLERQGMEPIILHEQPNNGQTLIEKLESKTADVRFGIVLYTPDDECKNGRMRARQNVVFEHGLLIGLLGRSNTCAIIESSVEKPGDINGVVYIDKVNWQMDLLKELRAVGLPVDMNKL